MPPAWPTPSRCGGRPLRTAFLGCPSSSPCKHTLLLPSWASDFPCPIPGGGGNCPSMWMPASHPCPPRTLTLSPVRAAFLPASVTCSPLGNLVKNADYWVPLPEVMTQSIDMRWWNPQPQQLLLMQVVWVTISEIPFSSGIIGSKGKAHLIFWHVLLNRLSERLYPGATPPAMRSSSSLSPRRRCFSNAWVGGWRWGEGNFFPGTQFPYKIRILD